MERSGPAGLDPRIKSGGDDGGVSGGVTGVGWSAGDGGGARMGKVGKQRKTPAGWRGL
ncbi:hypothetical protein GCM10007972_17210 [Iodidimonas muriae]|uniref:Uncharacterized protein n=1 Tax=Iodidimonas muriae TaxID=261467 RepID=A0ABQ2LEJ8_9PROT|nr:hypothetical protein GCM10007972_17210 [Iodidimonas muriae]